MKSNKFFAAALIILAFTAGYSQLPEFNYQRTSGIPVFYYDLVSFAKPGSDSTAVTVYTKICYDELQFLKTEPGFRATYELTILLTDKKGRDKAHRIVNKEINEALFENTNSRTLFSITKTNFVLKPGIYKVNISLTDLDAKKTRRMKSEVEVPEFFSQKLMISDLLIADSLNTDSTGIKIINPNVFGNFLDNQKFLYVYSEIYSLENIQDVKIKLKLADKDNNEKVIKKFTKKLEGSITPVLLKLGRKELKNGKYDIIMTVESSKYVAGQKRPILIKWQNMPSASEDLDEAIEQMRWIAKSSFLKKLRKMDETGKKRVFSEFWKSLDPSPGTEENEIMDEYYKRVEIATENFGTFLPGWKTDRGMVYIILGPPDDVERHPFEVSSKPYEVWFYQQFNRDLYFMDERGYGEYRLINPEIFWEMVNRTR